VKKHDSADDIWIILQDQVTKERRVYDVTSYVLEHPGALCAASLAAAAPLLALPPPSAAHGLRHRCLSPAAALR